MLTRWWIVWGLAAVGIPRLGAHQELYHNMVVDLVETAETGVAKISFTIHAPELLVGSAEAADAMYDSRWLGKRTDKELQRLVDLARRYMTDRFQVHLDGADPVELGEELTFEDFESIRGGEGRGLPPACLLARLELVLPAGARELRVEHAEGSEKRLMMVIERLRTFPGVIDVEPGSRTVVKLPSGREEPREPEGEAAEEGGFCPSPVAAVAAGMAVIGLGFFLARRGRRRAGQREGGEVEVE